MANHPAQWVRVAAASDVPAGEARAVRLPEGRSIALFNVDGRIWATDNQCPHMGYPLTRGAVRNGVLTCDWHGRSFDLEGGGCFNRECDEDDDAHFLMYPAWNVSDGMDLHPGQIDPARLGATHFEDGKTAAVPATSLFQGNNTIPQCAAADTQN